MRALRHGTLTAVLLVIGLAATASCLARTWPWTDKADLGGVVVEFELAPGAADKQAVDGIGDSGVLLFGSSILSPKGHGTMTLGGVRIPKWVRVIWREGNSKMGGRGHFGGTIVGDYTIPVLDRIPDEIFDAIRAKRKRALVLRFRVKDDGVLLGWAVKEGERNCRILYGGDFVDQVTTDFDVKRWRDHVIEHRWVHSESRGPVLLTVYRPIDLCDDADARKAAREGQALQHQHGRLGRMK